MWIEIQSLSVQTVHQVPLFFFCDVQNVWFHWLLCHWFSYFTDGYEHLFMEYQKTEIQSRKTLSSPSN